jgi:hypothetical protein
MNDTALRLTESILPHVPVRQWVLSYPPPLRFHLAYDADLSAAVLAIFMREVFRHYRHVAKRELNLDRVADAHPGGVLVIQRSGSALNLNFHPHALVLDGIYVQDESGQPPRFHALPAPTRAELDQVAWEVCCRTQHLLVAAGKAGSSFADELDALPTQEPLLADCATASMLGTALFGDHAGQQLLRLGIAPSTTEESPRARPAHGFDLHAGVRVPAHDRRRLFRLCQYVLRPPLAHDRLKRLDDGRVRLRLKRPWRDGTSHLVMDPEDLIARLLPLVPPPRVHQIRYYGVLAPRARLRPLVVPQPESDTRAQQLPLFGHRCEQPAREADANALEPYAATATVTKPERIRWARLMRKTLDLDVETCPRCRATMKIVDVVLQPEVIRAILVARGELDDIVRAHPPRGRSYLLPLQLSFGFASASASATRARARASRTATYHQPDSAA